MPTKPLIVLGIDAQPIGNFDRAVKLGANTLVRYDSGPQHKDGPFDWMDEAKKRGLFYIVQGQTAFPSSFDDDRDHCLAVAHDDEPDRRTVNPAQLAADYVVYKKEWPEGPVFVNFDGGRLTNGYYDHGRTHQPYIDAADWLCSDFYPRNKQFSRYPINLVGVAIDRLIQWGRPKGTWTNDLSVPPPPGKPVYSYYECSDQVLDNDAVGGIGRGPTPQETCTQIWHSLAHGARGVIAFPQRIGQPFQYWAMTPAVEESVADDYRQIARFENLIANGKRTLTTDVPQTFNSKTGVWTWAKSERVTWELDGEVLTVHIDLSGAVYPTIVHTPKPVPAPQPKPRLQGLLSLNIPGFRNKSITIDTELEV